MGDLEGAVEGGSQIQFVKVGDLEGEFEGELVGGVEGELEG